MSFWYKELDNGSNELGTDEKIAQKIASWSRGAQNIIAVTLEFNDSIVTIKCPKKDGKVANWEQLDGFAFSTLTGISKRVDRQLYCTSNSHQYFNVQKKIRHNSFPHLVISFNDSFGESVPSNVDSLVCSITIDGKVNYRWS